MEQHQKGIYGGRDGGFLLEYIPAGVTIGDQVDDQGQASLRTHQMPLKPLVDWCWYR